MIYVILLIFSLYGSLLLYSIEICIVDYVVNHCLLHMLYVLGLAIYSKLCRGVYAVMLFAPLRIILTMSHYVVSTVCSFIIGLHTILDITLS